LKIDDQLKVNYKLSFLSNKLRLLTVPMPTLASATVTAWVKTGSRDEEERVNGISHFLEHMSFKGSKKRPSAKLISEAVDAIGGEFNAATSKDWTNFYIKARAGNIETSFDILSDMLFNPLLKPAEIEREKGVIVEEINMYEDTPVKRIWDVFEETIFAGTSLGWDIAGTEKTVRTIERDDFVSYRKAHYYPENMLLTVSGGIDEKEVGKLAEKYFPSLSVLSSQLSDFGQPAVGQSVLKSEGQKTGKLISENQKLKTDKQNFPRVKLHPKKKDQAHFILGFQGHGRGYPGRFAEAVLSAILGGGMSSRLFLEVRERYQETGYLCAYAGVDTKRVDEAVKVMLGEFNKLASAKVAISQKELRKAKEIIKGHLALSLEDTRAVNTFFGEKMLFLGRADTPEAIFSKVDKVTVGDVLAEAGKLFVPERLNLAIIGPYDDQEHFEKLIK
jgi:predicted Zn-dependent peptidase